MRVLFVIAHLDKGGGQAIQAAQLFDRLAPQVDGEMICLKTHSNGSRPLTAGRLTEVGNLRFPSGVWELRRAIEARRGRFDIVQAFDAYYALPACRFARARPLVVRFGAHPTEDLASRYGLPGRTAMRLVNPWLLSGTTIVVNAPQLIDALPGRSAKLIPNGVDLSRFSASPNRVGARRSLGLPPDVPLICYTGKIIPRKSVDELYRALRDISDLHLLLVGTDNEPFYGDGYHRAIRKEFSEVLPRVHHVGEVSPEAIPRYLEASDLFVFPSRLEGMPNSVLEAMAAGLPVIASDTPAHRSLGLTEVGRLYRSQGELADAIRGLMGSAEMRKQMSSGSRKLVEQRFSFEAACSAYLELYRSLTANRAAS
ncbi:MAG TPA: glycosyltransferase family 4 protein [Thermoplasmata archaeon]|nr:glycosyltransferase family 4 protein [Thermoplasmata archaeon]